MKKSLETIDLVKFVASILIFAMHCGAFDDYRYASVVLVLLSRWCVPFFFVCSAYFLFRKSVDGNVDKETIRAYIRRIGMLYLVWLIINLPNVYDQRLSAKDLTAISTWLVFLKNSLLCSTFTGSWYLVSCIFSAWLVYALGKKLGTKAVMGITAIFYILCVLTSTYKGLVPAGAARVLDFLCFPLNIFTGCFYFAIGKYIAENRETVLAKCNTTRALIASVVFYALFIAEIVLTKKLQLRDGTDMTFSMAFLAASMFLFCLQFEMKVKNNLLLRKLSTIIYCGQGNVIVANAHLKRFAGVPSVPAFLISSAAIALICVAVLHIQKHTSWKWTKYLT